MSLFVSLSATLGLNAEQKTDLANWINNHVKEATISIGITDAELKYFSNNEDMLDYKRNVALHMLAETIIKGNFSEVSEVIDGWGTKHIYYKITTFKD